MKNQTSWYKNLVKTVEIFVNRNAHRIMNSLTEILQSEKGNSSKGTWTNGSHSARQQFYSFRKIKNKICCRNLFILKVSVWCGNMSRKRLVLESLRQTVGIRTCIGFKQLIQMEHNLCYISCSGSIDGAARVARELQTKFFSIFSLGKTGPAGIR